MQEVTLLSWNVAALRALAKDKNNAAGRSNWLRLKLAALGEPTCVCLQETKIPRDMLTEDVAILEDYHAFFSHAHRGVAQGGAYSGVVTYVRKELRVEAAVAGLVCCSYNCKKGVNDLPSTAAGKACPFACGAFREAWEAAVCALDDNELEEQQRRKEEESAAAKATFGDGRAGGGGGGGGGEGIDGDAWKEMMGKQDDDDTDENEEAGLTYEELVQATNPEDLLRTFDKEGRVVMTDHAAFVLINVYAPFNGQPGRARFKKAFHAALTARVQTLAAAGRQVILCGDLNAMPQALDSVEPPTEEELQASPWVRWMRDLLTPRAMAVEGGMEGKGVGTIIDRPEDEMRVCAGPPLLVDTFRALHPTQPNAFTCWCNQTGARQTNYGRRIDYVLASANLCGHGGSAAVARLTEAEVRQEVLGSDHCPVTARFAFNAAAAAAGDDHGGAATLAFSASSPFLAPGEEQGFLPPSCTSTFLQFRAKQTAMHAFLGSSTAKGAAQGMTSSASSTSSRATASHATSASASSISGDQKPRAPGGEGGIRDMGGRGKDGGKKRVGAPVPTQLTLAHYGISKQAKAKTGQGPDSMTKAAAAAAAVIVDLVGGEVGASSTTMISSSSSSSSLAVAGVGVVPPLNPADEASKREVFLNAFRSKKEEVPRCSGHGEPMVRRQVKKTESEHCGRYFFCCARPEGAQVDKEARCKTFVWEDSLAVGAGGKRVRGLLKKG